MRFMADYDVILSPVENRPPGHTQTKKHLQISTALEGWEAGKAESGGFCVAHNLTGWPAAVVRAGTSPEGLPNRSPDRRQALA